MAVLKAGRAPFEPVPELDATAGDTKPLDYVFRVGQAPRDLSNVAKVTFSYRPQNGGETRTATAHKVDHGVRVAWENAPEVPGIYRVAWTFAYKDGSTETLPREYMRIRASL